MMSPDRLDAVTDHVAVAVPECSVAARRWVDQLGGRWLDAYWTDQVYGARQVRYRGGAKLELIQPAESDPVQDNFVRDFLHRYGTRVHHVTLKVPDFEDALETLHRGSLDTVQVLEAGTLWKEAFLRPSQVGGLVVQVAWAGFTDVDRALLQGFKPEEPASDAARLLGPVLQHPDLDRAGELWGLLGADVRRERDELVATWADAPLRVFVRHGPTARSLHLRFSGAPPLPDDPDLGVAVEASDRSRG